MSFCYKTIVVGFLVLISHHVSLSQSINFGASGLVGANINNPTSLDFGPNNKLYVAQQDGIIWEYEVSRDEEGPGNGTYTILNSNQITIIKENTPNHNDDGTNNSTKKRQITGLLTAGTNTNPILYVTSSDSRIGGGGGAGNDVNLDTNSGILSRLRWNGSTWEKVDLVRGLPRCEENHSTNGLDLFTRGGSTYLLIQQGGNTNQGAPSNNFAGSSEYYLGGALLIVNITQLEQMEASNGGSYLDPRTNTPYIYDLPSLNDPERLDINNTHPNFPYSASHPLYNATIDLGDPFGGNNGLNQTFPENGGPVQIFSPGYRNAFDVVVTSDGRIFTGDNGPNGGWGGTPLIYDSNDQLKGTHKTTTYDSAAGDYITNEFNIENGKTYGDALHYVGTINDPNNTYYAGHPVPIRAFPDKAGVYKFEYDGNTWVENGSYDWSALISGVRGYFNTEFTMADFPSDIRQGEYLADAISSPKVNILDIVGSSTNGLCEYTASNFDGAMQGDILTASFNGSINRYSLDTSGTTLLSKDNAFLSGFGNIPLDLIAMGDNSMFPGTIWVVTYGADDITVFEPGDFGDCFQPGDPEYDGMADYDGDGFTNDDEINNGTNHCSAGSSPSDNDGDFISDLADPDDDNDGIPDNQDVFSIDSQNGLTSNLPILYPFWNNDPGTGFFGLGFTGLMTDPTGTINYLSQYDEVNLSFGGAGGKATVDAVSSGDALGSQNSQENAFQFGVNVDENSNPFTVHCKVATPFNGAAPITGQSYGVYIGNGDQDNYLKVALMEGVTSGDNTYGFEIVNEINGVSNTTTFDAPELLQAAGVDLYINVNPETNSARIFYSLNSGLDILQLGPEQTLASSFLNASDNKGMAVGIIGTSGSSNSTYIATWDFINITEDQPSTLHPNPDALDFESLVINSSPVELNLELSNEGSPANGAIEVSEINFSGVNANLFTSTLSLPLSVGPGSEILIPIKLIPDGNSGVKLAYLEVTHSGVNSPLIIPLNAVLSDQNVSPIVRINAGGSSVTNSTDDGPVWESNPSNGAYSGTSYTVNTGIRTSSSFLYSNRHSSIPDYIDQNTFSALFGRYRYDASTAPEMDFSIPVSNGNYTVNLYLGNAYAGTSKVGDRVFDILLEDEVVQDDLDLISTFGYKVAGMLSYPVTVNDGVLNVSFGHVVENPLVNAIEIISGTVIPNNSPVAEVSATPLTGAGPLEVTFTGSNSTDDKGIAAYFWDFGDGNYDTVADPVHTFNTEGNYSVSLTVTDTEGLQDTKVLLIEVTEALPLGLVANSEALDFGTQTINGAAVQIDLNLFNNDDAGEVISISAITFSGTDALLFSHEETLPLDVPIQNSQIIPITFTPDGTAGEKSATLEIIHSGANSPLIVSLSSETTAFTPLLLTSISDQFNHVGESSSLVLFASGGDPNENVTYSISNQPAGIIVESTNGHLTGNIDASALTGGLNNDGTYIVTVVASKAGSVDATQQFTWTITDDSDHYWVDKDEDENYTARHECSFVQAGDKFYLFGGRENAKSLDIYDYTNNSWNTLTNSAPIDFNHFQAVEYQGLIWVIGAFKTNTYPIEAPADNIWSFNPATEEWIQGPEIPSNRKRGSTGLVVYNGKFYILAGNTIGHSGGYVSWFDEYDPATGIWTELEDAPRPRDHFHAAVINGKLYAASGRLSGGEGGVFGPSISEVDVYDFTTQSWSTLPSVQNIPTPRAAAVVANFENKLIVSGGESTAKSDAFDVTEIYDPVSQSWSVGDPLNHQRHGTQGIVSGNGIFIVGGSPNRGGGNQKNMEFYGQDNPTGIASVASLLSASETHVFTVGETKMITVSNSGGNIGAILNSITISGDDASEFQIDSGNIPYKLINANSSHNIVISHTGSTSNKSATLTLNYNNSESLDIQLSVSVTGNQSPVAIASASDLIGEAPFEVSFTGSNSTDDEGVVAYYWDFGDGNTANTADPVHTYTFEGTYVATLTVTDAEGLQGSKQLTIEVIAVGVNQSPVALASASDSTGEAPFEVSFTGSNSTDDEGVVAYHWDFGDGNTDTSANPIHTYINEGNYIVTLTVTDIEGLQGTQQLTIDVAANMPASLVANPGSLDFGIQALDGAVTYLDLTLFNNGDAGEDISISAMTISGTDTSLFSIGETFPIEVLAQNSQIIPVSFTPDGSVGSKTAALEITHSGENSPLIISLDAVLNDPNMLVPLVRISAGSKTVIASTDGGPDWEKNSTNGAYSGTSFSVNTGTSYSGSFLYSNKHSSIPNYIDENTFKGLFNRYRYDAIAAPEMEYSIPVSNGTYTVNLFFGNGYSGTSQVGDRVFDVLIEGEIVQDNLDLIEAFGHQVAGMLSYVVTVNDGVLNIAFGHEVENPLINAIEIIGGAVISNQSPVAIASASGLTGEAPFEVSFTGSNSTDDEGVVAYYWDFGDGNTANTADPVHTYTSEGTYVATLTVTDAEGLQGSKQLTIEVIAVGVNQSPVALASASDSTGEAPFEVSFTGSNSTDDEGVVAYHWDFGDGNTDTSANPIHTYINEGNYIVTLTVIDIEGLQGTQQLTIDVAANMPASLVANPGSLDFGIQALDGAVTYLDLTLFNNGDAGEDISISAMTISGTDTSLFSIGETFPIDVLAQNSQIIPVSFTPDGSVGSKTAALEITHSGENSPLIISLDAVLNDPNMLVPLVRISAGSKTVIASTDGGPDWEKNSTNGAYSGTSFSVNTGTSYSGSFLYSNKHSSIPNYIDENTFKGLFNRYRYDAIAAPEMEYSIPVSNGTYTVNLFFGNGYSGTSQVGDRVFDVLIEGEIVQDNLDLIEAFGHQVAGMFSYPITVNDGVLNISFGHEVENPLISAIEIMGQSNSFVSVSKTDSVISSDSSFSDKSQESKLELNISCSLIPNPASTYTQLIFDNELLEVNAILIYNSNGQLVKSVNDPIKLNFKYDIKLFDLSEGLYFVNIMTSEGVMITKKLIIRY